TWAAPKGAAQTIKKVAELGWTPTFFLNSTATSVASVMRAAGIEHSQGIISVSYLKDPTDTIWANDAETKEWRSFMDKYMPDGDKTNGNHVYGYAAAQTLAQVLKQCGDDLTRENVMK
ncbi:ABC transporter substrate-binding protein, partial [Pseudomonas syringae pv. actinidiae]|nr:ABC transporter substrate-binding protein [Pseudomonas syringae pv. actinidiae]